MVPQIADENSLILVQHLKWTYNVVKRDKEGRHKKGRLPEAFERELVSCNNFISCSNILNSIYKVIPKLQPGIGIML